MSKQSDQPCRVVVVGGGAGGLELASNLQDKLGKKVQVTLIDASTSHIWKPLLHEVAAGTLDEQEALPYLAQARWRGFRFRLGYVNAINREKKEVYTAPKLNSEGEEIIPGRTFPYDILVMAVGSVSNSFGIQGVDEHCLFLDTTEQAFRFQKLMLEAYMKANTGTSSELSIAIIGAGATGVELAAELHEVSRQLMAYGFDKMDPDRDVKITIIEAANQLLPSLPPRMSNATKAQLSQLGITLQLGRRVVEVNGRGVKTDNGDFIPAHIKVWAAGIKAPEWLKDLDGLETNRINQLVVDQTLRTTRDDHVFALGDCAACPWPGHEGNVPPRAQAAHQQASTLTKSIRRILKGKEPVPYIYKDYGSLVSLGKYTTVGNLMGNLMGSVSVGGFIARMFYLSLHKMHQVALYGYFRAAMLTLSNLFRRGTKTHIKLH